MGESIAEVAAGLTEAQREFIASRPGHWWTILPSSERRAYRGLVRRWGYETNCLTPRGRALQAHLISQGADHDH